MRGWLPCLLASLLPCSSQPFGAQTCPSETDTATAVVGTVRDLDHRVPLVGARVRARWRAEGVDAGEGEAAARTDASGRFRLCGIPLPTLIWVSARVGSRSGPEQALRVAGPRGEPGEIHLWAPLDDPDASSGLFGRLVARDDGRPVQGAEVRLEGRQATQVTNREGNFVFDRVPPGSYVLHVEHLAYAPYTDTVHLAPSRPLQMLIPAAVEPIPVAGIEVFVRTPTWMRRRADLHERMERGGGHFITRSEISDRGEPPLSSLLRSIPGVRIERVVVAGREIFYPVIRGSMPIVYVDGARVGLVPGRGLGIDDFLSSDIDVVEVYRGPASAPIGSTSSCAGCGVIQIWTRLP